MCQWMRNQMLRMAVGTAFLTFVAVTMLQAQNLRGVGSDRTRTILPSERLDRTLGYGGGQFTSASQFTAPTAGQEYAGYGPTGGVSLSDAWRPVTSCQCAGPRRAAQLRDPIPYH